MCQWKRFTKNKNKFLMFMYIRFLILLFDSHWHVIFQFGPFELDFRLINSQRDLMFQSFEEITWELNISSQNICCYWLYCDSVVDPVEKSPGWNELFIIIILLSLSLLLLLLVVLFLSSLSLLLLLLSSSLLLSLSLLLLLLYYRFCFACTSLSIF